jgi:hypothetical protein
MILLLGLGLSLFALLGITGGLVCYGLARALGTPSIGVSIVAGFMALVIVLVMTPVGVGLAVYSLPGISPPLLRSALTLAAVVLGPISRYQEVLLCAVPAAIGAGLMFYWCPPLLSSVLLAILAPLVGLAIGVLIVGQVGDSNSYGDTGGRRDGLIDIGGDGPDGAGGGDGGGEGD